MNEEPQQVPTLPQAPVEMTSTFSNPICKQTYNSLPRIYGKKKKHIRQLKSPNDQQPAPHPKHYYSANEDHHSTSAIKKKKQKRELSVKLSQPKGTAQCSKIKCSCKQHQQTKQQSKKTTARRVLLPQIRKFDLEDLESQHKVSMTRLQSSKLSSSSGLQKIIEEQEQMRATKTNFAELQQKTTKSFHKIDRTEEDDSSDKVNILRKRRVESMADQKNRHRFKPSFNNKFDIQEESEEEVCTDELKNSHPSKNNALFTGRYKTDANDSESPKSNNSISLSSFVFKGMKRVNTKFHDLNKTQKSFESKKLSRQASQLSNGLFRIPEQPEYQDYIRHHRPLTENFTVKKLIKQPNFRIVRSDGEVYFGGLDQQHRKHGTGLNVTEKQIFEGSYDKNIKVVGCERNIDGVYEGGFLNGLRSGFGTFKWNNGEIFQGNWENGMKQGMGTWKSPKGDSYVGMWRNNRQEGEGVFKHRMSTYTGEFKNFLKHGFGEEVFANGDVYKGNYCEGKPHGRGRYQWKEGGHYEGDFVKGMREGKGKWADANGTIYEVQACSKMTSSMDLGKSGTAQASAMKDSLLKETDLKGISIKKVERLFLQTNEQYKVGSATDSIFFYSLFMHQHHSSKINAQNNTKMNKFKNALKGQENRIHFGSPFEQMFFAFVQVNNSFSKK